MIARGWVGSGLSIRIRAGLVTIVDLTVRVEEGVVLMEELVFGLEEGVIDDEGSKVELDWAETESMNEW